MSEQAKKCYVITGPSGAGVNDVCAAVLAMRSDTATVTPITARKMKAGEKNGVGFWFYDLEGWEALKENGNLLEQTVFAGNDYGTSRSLVNDCLKSGKNVILELEPSRAGQVKRNMPEAICISVCPSDKVLKERFQAISRSPMEVAVRMDLAEQQAKLLNFCDFQISGDNLDDAVVELNKIIEGRNSKELHEPLQT